MLRVNVEKAIQEAEEFIEAAKRLSLCPYDQSYVERGTKDSSAVRRKSMDLTRTLSKLRNQRVK